jgi:uncharacterized membrane protein
MVGLVFPRLEYHYFAGYRHGMTVSAATAVFSTIASGISEKGREVINEIYPPLTPNQSEKRKLENPPNPVTLNLPETQSLIVMPFAVGDIVIEGETFLTVHGGRLMLPRQALRHAVNLERQRTFEQDPKYALRLLVDIAIKALSPAVNDPTTAVQALNQIEDLLRRLGVRNLDVGQVKDETGALRLIFPIPTWEHFLSLAFDEICLYGANSLQVMRRLRTVLYDVAGAVPPERKQAVRHYIEHLDITVRNCILDNEDQTTALQQDRQG